MTRFLAGVFALSALWLPSGSAKQVSFFVVAAVFVLLYAIDAFGDAR